MPADAEGGSLEGELASLTERLVARFGGRLDRGVVEEAVRRHAASLADAPIRDFVPLLVERSAVAELTARLSTAPGPG